MEIKKEGGGVHFVNKQGAGAKKELEYILRFGIFNGQQ